MNVYTYVTSRTGHTHLIPHDPTATKTLCGLSAARMILGDETLTGPASTCNTCRGLVVR